MRVLVFSERASERHAVARILQGSCTVETAADGRIGAAVIAREAPEVLVVSWPRTGGRELLRLLRGADSAGHMYIVALLDPCPHGRDVAHVLSAGAHDFLRRPVVDGEIVARVYAPTRLLPWAKAIAKPRVFDLSGGIDMSGLQMWKRMGEVISGDFEQLMGHALTVSRGWPKSFGRGVRGATIPMSLATEGLELMVSVLANPATLKWLGGALLGHPDAGLANLDDVLRELANTAGGAVKRAALPENITFTTGIPFNENAVHLGAPDVQAFSVSLDGGAACLAVVGEIRKRENHRVSAAGLREGMVLVHDVRSDSGALLVTAGSRLTSTTAQRLATVLGPSFVLEVARAA